MEPCAQEEPSLWIMDQTHKHGGTWVTDHGVIRKFKEKVKRWKNGPHKESAQEAIEAYTTNLVAYNIRVEPAKKALQQQQMNARAYSQSVRQPGRSHKSPSSAPLNGEAT